MAFPPPLSRKFSDELQDGLSCYRKKLPLHFSRGQYAYFSLPENMNCPDRSPWRPLDFYDEEATSSSVVVVGNYEGNEYVLFGALTANHSFTHFIVRMRGSLPEYIEARQEDIPADGSILPEKLIVLEGNDWLNLLEEYAKLVAAENDIRPFSPAENLTGYCSWYYYFANVTEEQYLENAARMAQANQDGTYKASIIQIDDGYQTYQGDWFDLAPAWKTPLKDIAKKVTDLGLIPGIWLMPFLASTDSKLFNSHPEWFVKNELEDAPLCANGWTFGRDNVWACLDTTQPEVLQHLQNVFKTFHEWGFRYFKLDGQANPMIGGRRTDPAASPVSAFRKGMKAIRDAVPDDYLMSCTSSFMPCLGLCNGIRTSCDTGITWERVRLSWQGSISRFWMFDRWFRCDPDVMVTRMASSGNMTIEEARFSALNGILTGISMTSDRLEELPKERLEILSIASSIRIYNVRPMKWPVNSWPMIFTGLIKDKQAVALYNWTDKNVSFSRSELHLDISDTIQILLGENLHSFMNEEITLRPHDAALLCKT